MLAQISFDAMDAVMFNECRVVVVCHTANVVYTITSYYYFLPATCCVVWLLL